MASAVGRRGRGGFVAARIGKAHGIRGEVTVALHTDSPQERFAPGTRFDLEPGAGGVSSGAPGTPSVPDALTLAAARLHNGTWLLSFEEILDRNAAESLRGRRLLLSQGDQEPEQAVDRQGEPEAEYADEDDAWYEEELVGLRVQDPAGRVLGTVSALHTRPAQDLLEIRLPDQRTVPVPFVTALVPTVDVPAGLVVVDLPGGLLDLAE